jgi:hypothetical protein
VFRLGDPVEVRLAEAVPVSEQPGVAYATATPNEVVTMVSCWG